MHGHGYWPNATVFPTQLSISMSWDEALIKQMAVITAIEMNHTGSGFTLAPVLCIARDPRWGRVGETFGEDPYLIGLFAAAMVRGYNENNVMACAKHFVAYSDTIGGKDASEASHSKRKLQAFFLPAFQKVVDAGIGAFMSSYEPVDGTPSTANKWLLRDLLKGAWNFSGFVVTDWDCVGDLINRYNVAETMDQAAKIAVEAGTDMVLVTGSFHASVVHLVKTGQLDEGLVNDSVSRVLTKKFELGLFEDDRYPDKDKVIAGTPEHRQFALQAARESLVLLKNNGMLPLKASSVAKIAILGPNADHTIAQKGDWALGSGQDWSGAQPRELTITVVDGIKARFPGADVQFVPGCAVEPDEPTDIDAAIAAADAADLVIVVVGDRPRYWGESKSLATLDLQGTQLDLLEALTKLGKPFILNFIGSKPLILPADVVSAAGAVIAQFSPGMLGGQAFAEVITGDVNPGGRLTISWPRHVGQIPVHYNLIRGLHGGYADLPTDPQWAFGYGLSYSQFTYSDAALDKSQYFLGDEIVLSLMVWNKGPLDGTEIVQFYLHDRVVSAAWPSLELKAFQRVTLKSGEYRTIEIRLNASECSIVDAQGNRVVEPGWFEAHVGKAANDILFKLSFSIVE
jgi:beta-glucosidase